MDYYCSNKACSKDLRGSQFSSKKENGTFYFMCEQCNTIHKAHIGKSTFNLIVLPVVDKSEIYLAISKIEASNNYNRRMLTIKYRGNINELEVESDECPF